MKCLELCLFSACVAGLVGCGGSSDASNTGAAGGGNSGKPVYAIESLTFGMNEGDSSTSYVLLLDSLDTQAEVKIDNAVELPGYAPLDTIGGKLYAGSGEEPTVTPLEVADDLSWTALDHVSFGNYTSAPLQGYVMVDPQQSFVALNDQNWVSWNPTALATGAVLELPSSIPQTRGELTLQRGYGHEIVGKSVYQPYYWADKSFQSYSQESQIAVLDAASSKFTSVIEAPCPHLHIATQDESGNLYFSNGNASIASAALDPAQPRNCIVRVKKGATSLDEAFTVDFKDLAEGREGSNFFYVGNDVGFFNVYHAERDDKQDPAYNDVMYSASYHLWTLDLKTMTAKIMDGIDFSGGQYVAFHLGDRVFVAIPNGAYSSTAVYEITAAGAAEKRFDVQGWAFKMLKVR
jgi:hypothetical protein